jgi:hypothetical protein
MENRDVFVSGPELETLSDQQKKIAIGKVLAVISKYNDMVVSGSFSLQISNKRNSNNPIDIDQFNFDALGDLDIGSVKAMNRKEVDSLNKEMTRGGFKIHDNMFLSFSPHHSEMDKIAISVVNILFNGQTFPVRYTTPAFLLVTLVSQGNEDKTPTEKRERKIKEIQESPTFSKDDFITLARYEVDSIDRMNEQTFKNWKRGIEEIGGLTNIEAIRKEADNISSLIDVQKLIELLKTGNNLSDINFFDIRRVTSLEAFLRDFK